MSVKIVVSMYSNFMPEHNTLRFGDRTIVAVSTRLKPIHTDIEVSAFEGWSRDDGKVYDPFGREVTFTLTADEAEFLLAEEVIGFLRDTIQSNRAAKTEFAANTITTRSSSSCIPVSNLPDNTIPDIIQLLRKAFAAEGFVINHLGSTFSVSQYN